MLRVAGFTVKHMNNACTNVEAISTNLARACNQLFIKQF